VANTIKIKRSTGSSVPASLAFGELAYSSGSGKLYFGSSTDGTTSSVTLIGGAYLADLLDVTAGTASASKALIVDASRNIGNLGTVTASSFVGALTGNVTGTVSDISNHNTNSLAEGTGLNANLYFTQTRARDSVGVAAGSSDALTYDSATGKFSFSDSQLLNNLDTDDIAEGTTNLYFTQTRARDSISVTDAGGDGSMSYNAATGVITYTGPSASEVRAHFSAGTGVTITDGQVAIGQAVGTTSNVTFNNVTVDGTLNSNDITAESISISGAATVTGALTVTGNLTVNGTTTTVNSTTLEVADKNIVVSKGATTAAAANGAGLTVEGPETPATLTYSSADDRWNLNKDLTVGRVYGNVTGALTGNADTATALQTARNFSASGDASASAVSFDGSAAVDLALELATVNTNVGTYGSSSAVPVVTVNAKGLVTAVSTASISTSFTAAGDTGSETFANGKTLTVAGGEGIDTAVTISNGDVTITVSGEDASDTNKGIASFYSTNFSVAGGHVAIKAGGVGTPELDSAAVTEVKIASDAVTTAKIADGAVTNAKLANSSITLTGGSGSDAVALGESLAISGSGAISTAVTANTVTVSVAVATTTGTKGVAAFNPNHFTVTDGVVDVDLDGGTY
jgi:hypothetical protein